MNIGDTILCPIYSIAHKFIPISGDALVYDVVNKDDQYFLKRTMKDTDDLLPNYESYYVQFRFACVGLSVKTHGHFWVQDSFFNEKWQTLWERRKTIHLIPSKEIGANGPEQITPADILESEDIMAWIAINYPRVFTYYTVGLFLLRTSYDAEYFYADVLLNFFKIIELITHIRTKQNPDLKNIQSFCQELEITSVEDAEIKQFYIVRSKDSAHDYDAAAEITREQAIDCKLWVDELIVKDMNNRSEPASIVSEIREGPSGATIRDIEK